MKTEQELQAQIDALDKDIEPQRDLWPELAARLATTPQRADMQFATQQPQLAALKSAAEKNTSGWFWWSGGMAAAVLVSVLMWPQGAKEPQLAQQSAADITTQGESEAVLSTAQVSTALAGNVEISKVQWQLISDFETQRAAILAQIDAVPEFYPDWQQQVAIWQQARQQVLLALSYQPDEPVLLLQLNKLQQQQMHYLQKLVSNHLTYSGVTS